MSNKTPEELAQEVSAQGTFSFSERLKNRQFATDDVTICLNEAVGYQVTNLLIKLDTATEGVEVAELEAKVAELQEAAKADTYIMHMTGISPKAANALGDRVIEAYPYEYDVVENPLTGEKTKTIIESEKRTEMHQLVMWTACCVSVEDCEGNIEKATEELMQDFVDQAPLMAQVAVNESIEKLKMAYDWMKFIQDEDFFPKP